MGKHVVIIDLLFKHQAGCDLLPRVEVTGSVPQDEGDSPPIDSTLPHCRFTEYFGIEVEGHYRVGL